MKKIDVGRTINTLANLGVIGGIVFLAFEIRQNTATMQSSSFEELHSRNDRVIDGAGFECRSE